jgi:TolB-like protein
MVNRLFGVFVFMVVLMSGTVAFGVEGSGASRFLFFPFDSSSAGKYAYLAQGIHSMLASRLAAKSGIQLVDYVGREAEMKSLEAAAADRQQVSAVFEKLRTDYLVSGAVYATDTGLKIQTVVSSAENPRNPLNFNGVAETEEQIIAVINTMADEIAGAVVASHQPAETAPVAQENEGIAGFRTEHPEKQYKKGMLGGGAIVSSEGSTIEASAEGMKRSSIIPVVIVAMDAGDIDGDGMAEIVFASRSELQVFRYREGRFQKGDTHSLRSTFKIHALSLADLDRDGKAEIYVSANERYRVASMILEWSPANTLSVKEENIPWFLRPLNVPGEGMVLAGQMSGNESRDGFVRAGIFRLDRAGSGKLVRGARLPVPDRFNLFDFVWADLEGDKALEMVAVDRNEKLLVYDSGKNLVFVSDAAYGGSTNYLGPDRLDRQKNNPGASASGEDSDRELAYVPTRLLARDVDGDGKQEIIIGRNKRVTPLFMRNFREYEGGTIACLGWNNATLAEMWRTNTIPGYIADYSFFPAGKPMKSEEAIGRAQLYVGQIPADTFLGLLAAKESKMLVYELKLPGK